MFEKPSISRVAEKITIGMLFQVTFGCHQIIMNKKLKSLRSHIAMIPNGKLSTQRSIPSVATHPIKARALGLSKSVVSVQAILVPEHKSWFPGVTGV